MPASYAENSSIGKLEEKFQQISLFTFCLFLRNFVMKHYNKKSSNKKLKIFS